MTENRSDFEVSELEFDDDTSVKDRQDTIDSLQAEQELTEEMDGLYRDMTNYN